MRAVNLIPADERRAGRGVRSGGLGPGFAVLGVLGIGLVLVTLYVLSSNTISDRKVKLAALNAQISQVQASAGQLSAYATYTQLAHARVATVTQIAQSRFDWHSALADLSRVVPANASLTSLVATASPGSTVAGGTGNTGSLRGDIAAPAFQISGCTASHDDVARLMSRLRLINGVQRVTLSDSVKQSGGAPGTAPTAGPSSSGAGCTAAQTGFDLVVFFAPIPGSAAGGVAAAGGPTPAPGAAAATTTPATATPATTTPAGGAASSTAVSNPPSTTSGSTK